MTEMCIRDSGNIGETIAKQQLGDCYSSRTCTVHYDAAVLLLLADNTETVDDACQYNDSGSVLVIMEYRNIQALLQLLLNFEAAGRGDVLQIDASEDGSDANNCLYDLIHILCVQADRECVDTAEFLEENTLAFHNRDGSFCADVAETEYGAAVRDNGYRVLLDGIFVYGFRVASDYAAGLCYTGSVCQGQILAAVYFGLGGCF